MKSYDASEETPVAWIAVLADTPVLTVGGDEVGTVAEVLGSEAEDIFHGIVLRHGILGHEVMIPAQNVTAITNKRITTDLSAEAVRALPQYVPEETFKLGFVGFLGRHLGWVRDGREEP